MGTRLVGDQATAYRLGGDEFCVLSFPGTKIDVALLAAGLAETDRGLTVTVACGSADIPEEAQSPSAALSLADRRMYADKALAPGRVATAPPPAQALRPA